MLGGRAYTCAVGRSGVTSRKREGDGATPRASMQVLAGYYRAERVQARQSFWQRIKPSDGWCDAPFTPAYNRSVALPWPVSHETLTRDNGLYDHIVVLDWNITSRRQGLGSAIFAHHARFRNGTMQPTEGCVALAPETMRKIAPLWPCIGKVVVR
ncbi:MAG: hypothetical protein KI785_14240 [Devosiaceae bacterium]|nr:hypothetical protein [Devosiaceae bacterium MH13]